MSLQDLLNNTNAVFMNCHTPCYSYDRVTKNIALTSQRKMLVEQFFDHLQLLHCFVILRYPSAHFSGNWISRDFSLKVICLDCKVLTHQQSFFNLFFQRRRETKSKRFASLALLSLLTLLHPKLQIYACIDIFST